MSISAMMPMTTICRLLCRRNKNPSAAVLRKNRPGPIARHAPKRRAVNLVVRNLELNRDRNHGPNVVRNHAENHARIRVPNPGRFRPARNKAIAIATANGRSAKNAPIRKPVLNGHGASDRARIVHVRSARAKKGPATTARAKSDPNRSQRAANVPARNVPSDPKSHGPTDQSEPKSLALNDQNEVTARIAPNGLSAANVRNEPSDQSARNALTASEQPSRLRLKLRCRHDLPGKSLRAKPPKNSPRRPPAAISRRSPVWA